MKTERMMELLKIAVNHIENFEDSSSAEVLESLGFTKDELAEINMEISLSPRDKKNLSMVSGKLIHNGEVIWELSEEGRKFIFADQKEDSNTLNGWRTENIPFQNYSHYFFFDEVRNIYTGYAWYSEGENYVQDFRSLEECLDWLVPERELEKAHMKVIDYVKASGFSEEIAPITKEQKVAAYIISRFDDYCCDSSDSMLFLNAFLKTKTIIEELGCFYEEAKKLASLDEEDSLAQEAFNMLDQELNENIIQNMERACTEHYDTLLSSDIEYLLEDKPYNEVISRCETGSNVSIDEKIDAAKEFNDATKPLDNTRGESLNKNQHPTR